MILASLIFTEEEADINTNNRTYYVFKKRLFEQNYFYQKLKRVNTTQNKQNYYVSCFQAKKKTFGLIKKQKKEESLQRYNSRRIL